MVEVVEHLDPGASLAAGPALLGGLRPKIAVVTTPNIEYNPVRSKRMRVGGKCEATKRSGMLRARLSAAILQNPCRWLGWGSKRVCMHAASCSFTPHQASPTAIG
jgi:hypothetical protein